uniref:Uncharacterized protein n=1 Tax=Nelumbo nucifera TaxID=4432 RepID=A0A822XRH8_NELNU|nr:TPA_asm: hypothetical protein HUJ06_023172 [Nelumbo nucifera]
MDNGIPRVYPSVKLGLSLKFIPLSSQVLPAQSFHVEIAIKLCICNSSITILR